MSLVLQDNFNRKILYLRLSLTERCNLACKYCLPFGYKGDSIKANELTIEEINTLVKTFTTLGVTKVRLTGGEPTLRKDFIDIVKNLKTIKEIKTLAVTTNGVVLLQKAYEFYNSGIDTINFSLDSLDINSFKQITGYKRLDKILQAIDLCLNLPFKKIKINAVLLREFIKHDFPKYLEYVKNHPIDVRFIELMHTKSNEEFFKNQHLSASEVKENLLRGGWKMVNNNDATAGPSSLFSHKDYKGCIGFITPYSDKFCSNCNRVRVNSIGELQLCLFGKGRYSLRSYLQKDSNPQILKEKIIELLKLKPKQHLLEEGELGIDNSFSKIGG